MPENIPLAEAQVIWSWIGPNPDDHAAVRVIAIPGKDDTNYSSSWGACNLDFAEASAGKKLLMLFQQFRDMTLDGVDPQDIHGAFQAIPEYRAATHPSMIAAAYDEEYQ